MKCLYDPEQNKPLHQQLLDRVVRLQRLVKGSLQLIISAALSPKPSQSSPSCCLGNENKVMLTSYLLSRHIFFTPILKPRMYTVRQGRTLNFTRTLHMQNPYEPHDSSTVLCFDPLMRLHFSHFPTEGGCNSVVCPVCVFLSFVLDWFYALSRQSAWACLPECLRCPPPFLSLIHCVYSFSVQPAPLGIHSIFITAYCVWK